MFSSKEIRALRNAEEAMNQFWSRGITGEFPNVENDRETYIDLAIETLDTTEAKRPVFENFGSEALDGMRGAYYRGAPMATYGGRGRWPCDDELNEGSNLEPTETFVI